MGEKEKGKSWEVFRMVAWQFWEAGGHGETDRTNGKCEDTKDQFFAAGKGLSLGTQTLNLFEGT